MRNKELFCKLGDAYGKQYEMDIKMSDVFNHYNAAFDMPCAYTRTVEDIIADMIFTLAPNDDELYNLTFTGLLEIGLNKKFVIDDDTTVTSVEELYDYVFENGE